VSPPEKRSAAAAAADRVRAVLEAAEQSAAELRAEAAEEIEGRLARAQAVAERLSARAEEIERALQELADKVRDELSSLKADLEELRAVGEGMGAEAPAAEPRPEAPAQPPAAPASDAPTAEEAASEEPTAALEEPASEEPTAALGAGHEGARVIALNMALNGAPRGETARYLSENFDLDNPEALLDEVYARVSG
jgi:hypothetical protein